MDKSTSISVVAALAFFATGAAFAQDTGVTGTGTAAPAVTAPDTGADATVTTPGMGSDTTTTTPGAATTTTMPPAGDNSDTVQAAPVTGMTDSMAAMPFVDVQRTGQWLASDLMGAQVRSVNDEDIGEVNDILFTQNGEGEAIIVGVGGFLGIGEKNVAIPFERLTVMPEEDGDADDMIVSLETTREELNGAPAFQTLEDADGAMSSGVTTEGVTPPTGATNPDAGLGATGTGVPATNQ